MNDSNIIITMNKNGLLADEARSNEVMQAECSNAT
jgi:hypothetical protein